MTHDRNFKNLILDCPRQALAFFVAAEAADIDAQARILPLRQGRRAVGRNRRQPYCAACGVTVYPLPPSLRKKCDQLVTGQSSSDVAG